MWKEKYKDCLSYIDTYWDSVTFKPVKNKMHHHVITIPHVYITPNNKRFDYIFYWDTYFMMRGLMGTKREYLMKKMVENFAYILERYGIIPNFNAPASMGNSQPPFFSSMILDSYTLANKKNGITSQIKKRIPVIGKDVIDKKWLKEMIELAKGEYWSYWRDKDTGMQIHLEIDSESKNAEYHHKMRMANFKIGANNHTVKGYILSRYGDRDAGYALNAERESGWDFTSRFYNRCNEFLPIDLNCFLLKYEKDFAKAAEILGQPEEKQYWEEKAKERIEEINTYMWNEKEGFFYDYGFNYQKISDFLSLAGFAPMWAGMATTEQAEQMVKKLPVFESDYGLIIGAKESLARPIDLSKIQKRYHPALHEIIDPKQWDYPQIWPPLEYLTVIGLLKYGFVDDAKRIIKKALKAEAAIFEKYGELYEKRDGINGDRSRKDFHYINQGGFGWTNAIFYRYVQILDTLESGEDIYENHHSDTPPYNLAILH